MISQLTKLGFSPDDDLTALEVISNVSDGVDEATSFGYEPDYERITIEDSQELPFKAMHKLTAIGLPNSGVDENNLLALNDPDQKAKIAAIGIDMALICLNSVRVEFLDKPDTGVFWRFYTTLATVPYRERATGRKGAGLHVGENLLSVYAWADADEDGVANGFDASDFTSPDFTAGVQSITKADNGNDGSFSFETFFFPFVGESLTFSFDVDSIDDGGHALSLAIQFLDNAGSEISTATTSFSTTGRKNVEATIPAGTAEVQVSVDFADNSASAPTTVELADPALRVDGKTIFTAF